MSAAPVCATCCAQQLAVTGPGHIEDSSSEKRWPLTPVSSMAAVGKEGSGRGKNLKQGVAVVCTACRAQQFAVTAERADSTAVVSRADCRLIFVLG
mgnify:CR=1 FL=1